MRRFTILLLCVLIIYSISVPVLSVEQTGDFAITLDSSYDSVAALSYGSAPQHLYLFVFTSTAL